MAFGLSAAGCLNAQQREIPPREIGQIIDEAFRVLVDSGHLTKPATPGGAKRGVYFDRARTLDAFGYAASKASISELGIKSPVQAGSQELLSDCDVVGNQSCARLGSNLYFWVAPISMTRGEARVRGYLSWAARSNPRAVKANLNSHVTELFLRPTADGRWKVVKIGVITVG